MAKVSYWLTIFFITLGVYYALTTWYSNDTLTKLGIPIEVVNSLRQSSGANLFSGKTVIEYESGVFVEASFSLSNFILCLPGTLLLLVLPATLIVYRKELRSKLQSRTSKLIFALILAICFVSLAISVKLMALPF